MPRGGGADRQPRFLFPLPTRAHPTQLPFLPRSVCLLRGPPSSVPLFPSKEEQRSLSLPSPIPLKWMTGSGRRLVIRPSFKSVQTCCHLSLTVFWELCQIISRRARFFHLIIPLADCSYTCDAGYAFDQVTRTKTITCGADGNWDPADPGTCERKNYQKHKDKAVCCKNKSLRKKAMCLFWFFFLFYAETHCMQYSGPVPWNTDTDTPTGTISWNDQIKDVGGRIRLTCPTDHLWRNSTSGDTSTEQFVTCNPDFTYTGRRRKSRSVKVKVKQN